MTQENDRRNRAEQMASIIRQNLKRAITRQGVSQQEVARKAGMNPASFSQMLNGNKRLLFEDMYAVCDVLGLNIADLMDATSLQNEMQQKVEALLKQANQLTDQANNLKQQAVTLQHADALGNQAKGALVGVGSPRFLVSPFNPDAPIEGGISGAAKGALAGFVPYGVPSGSGSPSSPSKHGGIGVSGRSQAHETLRNMTTIIMHTSEGSITINLFDDKAPNTVANFLGLATGEKEWADPYTGQPSHGKFYNGLIFHRIIKQFMIQGGCPLGTGTGGPGYEFDDEIDPSLKFDKPYLLAMANAGLRRGMDGKVHGTNGSQFFITTVPTPWLDGHHTIFGEVADDDSKKVVDKLEALDTDPMDRPLEPAVILSVDVAE
ncbi:Peptidyl-prolyl cis-trans isomerase [Bifidobacterium longum]|nr:Peptidyl-prolyl cis-trans isomerase [Bifidobacterium longum]